jgi:hypothetical protein
MATTDSEQNSYVRQETSFPDDLHVRMKRTELQVGTKKVNYLDKKQQRLTL